MTMPVAIAGTEETQRAAGKPSRVAAIDFVKGFLVVGMVVYHAMNYAGYDSLPREHLAFVPTSFIMIAGFLAMSNYGVRVPGPGAEPVARLVARGVKLLAIFTVLNVAARAVWSRNHYGEQLGVGAFFSDWVAVYLTASAPGVAFDVLVPIAYTLLLAVVVFALRARSPQAPLVVAAIAVAACVWLEAIDAPINSLHFLSAGLLGLWFGTRKLADINGWIDGRAAPVSLVVVYVACAVLGSGQYLLQMTMTVLALLVAYAVGRRVDGRSWGVRQLCLLGRYSLLSYIVQIFLLQASRLLERVMPMEQAILAVTLTVVVSIATWVIAVVVERARERAVLVDRIYRGVLA